MKRSWINEIIRDIENYIKKNNFNLPEWAYWDLSDWKKNVDKAGMIFKSNLGWDITDFGSGKVEERGLYLFTVRNGILGEEYKPYAEKMLIVDEDQETPFHKHIYKKEDIINRSGGVLVIQLYNSLPGENRICESSDVVVMVDSLPITLKAGDSVELLPGQSIFLDNHHYHRFFAKMGCGRVLAGEVSMLNNDDADNYFIDETVGRFSEIEEDCEPYRLLVGDYKQFIK